MLPTSGQCAFVSRNEEMRPPREYIHIVGTRALIFLALGLFILVAYSMDRILAGRAVQSGPIITSGEFHPTPDGFLASSRRTEKMLKQRVILHPNEAYRVEFDITGSSGPAVVVAGFVGTNYENEEQQFRLNLNAVSRPLRIDRVLNAGSSPSDKYLRISYNDPVKLGVANIRVSRYSRLRGSIETAALFLVALSLMTGLGFFLRSHWIWVRERATGTLRGISDFQLNWSTATILIFVVGLGTLIRNLAVNYPLILGDEGIFLIRAKYAGRAHMLVNDELAAWVPNSLYLWLNHSIFFLGSNYAIGARLINVLLLVVSLLALYGLASLFVSSREATLLTLVVGVGPMSVYTAFLMPETMFLCAFLWLGFVFVRHIPDRPIYASLLSGVVLGAASLIKPHGLMLIPIVLVALVILKLLVPEWCRWTTCGAAAGTMLASAGVAITLLNYWISGRVGFSLGPAYTTMLSKSSAASSVASILYVIRGHMALVLSLYALPVLVVMIAIGRGPVTTRTLLERIRLQALLTFTVLAGIVLLITTSKFTVSVAGSSPYEQLNRVHVRYYFFVLPLLLVLFAAVYERLDWTKAPLRKIFQGGCVVMCALAAYCILALDSRYYVLFPDFPDAFWFNMNQHTRQFLVLAGTCGALLAYACRRMSPAVFLCIFGVVSLVGNYHISRFVIQPATVTDRAAAVLEKIIGRERLDAGTVFDTEPADGEVYRLLFDLPAAYDVKIVTSQDPIPADMLPDEQQWAIVTSARPVKFQYGDSFVFGRYHLYMRGPQASAAPSSRQTDLAPSVPFLGGACAGGQLIGFQPPEPWGVWSAEDPARIMLQQEVRGRFSILLVSYLLGNNPSQTLQMQINDKVKTIQLRGEPASFKLEYDLQSPARSIVFRGIAPKSPFQLGISGDIRPLGFAIEKLDCAGAAGNPSN